MPTILLTGGTGLIGSALSKQLAEKGYNLIIVSRKKRESNAAHIRYAVWDVEKQTIEPFAIAEADYIIHLAGAGVAEKRWTEARKKEIVDSRVSSGALIVKALKEISNNVKAVISASAIGWYGDDKNLPTPGASFTEDMPADTEFLGDTCRQWEESTRPVEQLGKRLVIYRIGIVFSKDGGALPEFIKPINFGIAGFLGSGKQVISWIHIDDLCRLLISAVENDSMQGVYNAVAPDPISNKELTLQLAKRLRGSFYVPMHVPAFMIKLMLGGMSIEVLKSTTVSAGKIRSTGFQFLYPTIDSALPQLLAKS